MGMRPSQNVTALRDQNGNRKGSGNGSGNGNGNGKREVDVDVGERVGLSAGYVLSMQRARKLRGQIDSYTAPVNRHPAWQSRTITLGAKSEAWSLKLAHSTGSLGSGSSGRGTCLIDILTSVSPLKSVAWGVVDGSEEPSVHSVLKRGKMPRRIQVQTRGMQMQECYMGKPADKAALSADRPQRRRTCASHAWVDKPERTAVPTGWLGRSHKSMPCHPIGGGHDTVRRLLPRLLRVAAYLRSSTRLKRGRGSLVGRGRVFARIGYRRSAGTCALMRCGTGGWMLGDALRPVLGTKRGGWGWTRLDDARTTVTYLRGSRQLKGIGNLRASYASRGEVWSSTVLQTLSDLRWRLYFGHWHIGTVMGGERR
ncbi:hypothetical protein C8Q74DRAFT_1219556 [Fomes fomentarius]|nr:hypothetical protein C8Q74DRAFT_1219556 [Fomes fomentarius]